MIPTPQEQERERDHIYETRLAILCPDGRETASAREIAWTEANDHVAAWVAAERATAAQTTCAQWDTGGY